MSMKRRGEYDAHLEEDIGGSVHYHPERHWSNVAREQFQGDADEKRELWRQGKIGRTQKASPKQLMSSMRTAQKERAARIRDASRSMDRYHRHTGASEEVEDEYGHANMQQYEDWRNEGFQEWRPTLHHEAAQAPPLNEQERLKQKWGKRWLTRWRNKKGYGEEVSDMKRGDEKFAEAAMAVVNTNRVLRNIDKRRAVANDPSGVFTFLGKDVPEHLRGGGGGGGGDGGLASDADVDKLLFEGHETTRRMVTTSRTHAWGSGEHGRLGVPGVTVQAEPGRVGFFNDMVVRQVAAGKYHSAALTDDGAVYTWGYGEYGQLGHNDWENCDTPKRVAALEDVVVRHVACGGNFTAVVTDEGKLYTFGAGEDGQLGHGERTRRCVPTLVDYFFQHNVPIRVVMCGASHMGAISTDGQLYTWGKNSYNKLGFSTPEGSSNKVSKPKPVGEEMDRVVVEGVAFGEQHTLSVSLDTEEARRFLSTRADRGLNEHEMKLQEYERKFASTLAQLAEMKAMLLSDVATMDDKVVDACGIKEEALKRAVKQRELLATLVEQRQNQWKTSGTNKKYDLYRDIKTSKEELSKKVEEVNTLTSEVKFLHSLSDMVGALKEEERKQQVTNKEEDAKLVSKMKFLSFDYERRNLTNALRVMWDIKDIRRILEEREKIRQLTNQTSDADKFVDSVEATQLINAASEGNPQDKKTIDHARRVVTSHEKLLGMTIEKLNPMQSRPMGVHELVELSNAQINGLMQTIKEDLGSGMPSTDLRLKLSNVLLDACATRMVNNHYTEALMQRTEEKLAQLRRDPRIYNAPTPFGIGRRINMADPPRPGEYEVPAETHESPPLGTARLDMKKLGPRSVKAHIPY